MSLIYTFPSPVTVGNYPNQIAVSQVRIASIALNFEAAKATAATPVCAVSIVLEDPATGHRFANPQFADAACLAVARAMLAAIDPVTSRTFEADLLAKALTATDPASGKPIAPAGGTTGPASSPNAS